MANRPDWCDELIAEVEWIDSCTKRGWGDPEEYKADGEPILCRSVGYILKSTKKEVTLIQSMCAGGGIADSITIPRSCVRSIQQLKGGRK